MSLGHLHPPSGPEGVIDVVGWLPAAAAVGALLGGYLVLLVRRQLLIPRPWSPWRTTSWVIGCLLIGLGLSPLVHGPGASDHMLQHLLLGMYGPVFLVLGAPVTVVFGAAPPAWRRRLGKILGQRPVGVLTHPVTAGVLHVGPLFLLYLTGLYELTMTVPLWHGALNLHFVAAGCLFAWSIAGPDPAPRRPGIILRAVVLVLSAGLHAWLAKLLYAGAAELPSASLHAPQELRAAAELMYYAGDGAELILAVALFGTWYIRRRRRYDRARTAAAT